MIHPQLDINQVSRVISDLGVKNPQVIKQYNEAIVLEYFQNYPVTEYVRETIKVFESVVETIENLLEKENRESEIANAGIYAEIDTLGSEIMLLKQTDGYFVERDNYGLPQSFIKIRQNFEEQIKKWKNRKTKVTGDTEADIAAEEYNGYLKKYMNDFNDSILTSFQVAGEAIKTKYRDMYLNAGIDTEFVPTGITLCEVANEPFPEMKAELLSLKEITYVEQKNDFFSMFRKTTEENPEPVRVATCYYEQWRMKALELIMPLAEKVINSSVEALRTYYNELAEEYHLHLGKLISEKTEEKERVSSQLSDDERKLQEDNDWLAALKEQLLHLERG